MTNSAGSPVWRILNRLLQIRFVRFGAVGASGTLVNMVVLYSLQEHLLLFIESIEWRLNLSLASAILVATINNFAWNRAWTWADRGQFIGTRPLVQFGKYAAACWVGITLQFLITRALALSMHYLYANLIAIVAASIFNFLLNDAWTFEGLRLRRKRV